MNEKESQQCQLWVFSAFAFAFSTVWLGLRSRRLSARGLRLLLLWQRLFVLGPLLRSRLLLSHLHLWPLLPLLPDLLRWDLPLRPLLLAHLLLHCLSLRLLLCGLLPLLLDYLLLNLRLFKTSLRALFPRLWRRLRPGLALLRPASSFLLGPLSRSLLIGLSPHVLLSLNLLTGPLSPRLNLLLCSISSLLLGRDCLLTRSLFLGLLLLTCSFYLLSLSLPLCRLAHSFSLRLLPTRPLGPLLL